MLAYIVAAVGIAITLVGGLTLVAPSATRNLLRSMQTRKALYGAVAGRIVAGVFFVFASEACDWPMAIGTVGVGLLVAGLAGLFVGGARLEALTTWFAGAPTGMFRAWAIVAVLLGGFIVYAAV